MTGTALLLVGVLGCTGAVSPQPSEKPLEVVIERTPPVDWSQTVWCVSATSDYLLQHWTQLDGMEAGDGHQTVRVDFAFREHDYPTFPTSPSRAHFFMDSKLMTSSEPAIVDFELRWTTEYPEVVGVELQSVGGVPRYTYAKQGAYYVRVPAHP